MFLDGLKALLTEAVRPTGWCAAHPLTDWAAPGLIGDGAPPADLKEVLPADLKESATAATLSSQSSYTSEYCFKI